MDTIRLRVAAESVYLAAPSSVARNLSDMLTRAANEIEEMRRQNAKLADIIITLTAELARMEEKLKGESEIDKLASRGEIEYHEDKEAEKKFTKYQKELETARKLGKLDEFYKDYGH